MKVEKAQDVELQFDCKDCKKRGEDGLCHYRVYKCRNCDGKCETQTDGHKLWVECEECGMRGPNTSIHECDAWSDHCSIPSGSDWLTKSISAWDLHDEMESGIYLQFTRKGVTAVHLMFDGGEIRGRQARYGVDPDDPESPELEFDCEDVYFVGPVNDRVDTDLFPILAGYDDAKVKEVRRQAETRTKERVTDGGV